MTARFAVAADIAIAALTVRSFSAAMGHRDVLHETDRLLAEYRRPVPAMPSPRAP